MVDEGVESRSDGVHLIRFRWKSSYSIHERRRKIRLMLDEGVKSRSDGVHRIHWTRKDSNGKVHFLFLRDLRKIPPMLDERVESRSDGIHCIH